jgi:tetratricopeptide (TPR) repeat protein
MLVPVSGVIVQAGGHAMADRFTYLPHIGLYLALTWATVDLCRSRPFRRWLLSGAATLVLAALIGCAWRQTCFWRNSETLWTHTLACTSRNWLAHGNLGLDLEKRGRLDDALAHYRKALEIQPDNPIIHFDMGNVFLARKQPDEAMARFRQAVAIDPGFAEAHGNLGRALQLCGRNDEAMSQYHKALELRPNDAIAHRNLGSVLQRCGKAAEAIAEYQQALEIKPGDADAQNNLAWLRATCPQASLRNGAEAIQHAERANQLAGGKRLDVLDTLAAAYAEAGRFSEALTTARQAFELAEQQHDRSLANILRTRIALYEAGKPFHETLPASALPPPKH